MTRGLQGRVVVLTGTRKTAEMEALVRKLGGEPVMRPLQGTESLDAAHLASELGKLLDKRYDWLVFTTGVGFQELYDQAKEQGREADFLVALNTARVAVRGYKTARCLNALQVPIAVRDDDGSTLSLLSGMNNLGLAGTSVALQLHGVPSPDLVQALSEAGAAVQTILPYRHVPPAPETLRALITEITTGRVDAVTFTSALQVRFLLQFAAAEGQTEALLRAFSAPVVAAAVGKITARELQQAGVGRVVTPQEERVGAMFVALAEYFGGGAD
ncbi:uroporphyrinogen-III synthase [Alicyclobacillus cycloheptanicus]|uniref:Uroporphyrinogen-III synthase n=1 Tax=Alicyclobacillus cycloheptanicus TaxID=1457 RepID=A0ABT9XG48_9BACL|nr:uroporphyrinogen-III synthase [Alicyclobacillus cycloheptanicus]MDQ0188808.1 uroporphyrinogen-III synthase [Alicyclobacillus cycloheptanicus]WDM00542.1 uroporphyrinogen-III synthase [Alicyclobacillus cycloheptanicus]